MGKAPQRECNLLWGTWLLVQPQIRVTPKGHAHRRFTLLSGGRNLIMGMSLNSLAKDEAVHFETEVEHCGFNGTCALNPRSRRAGANSRVMSSSVYTANSVQCWPLQLLVGLNAPASGARGDEEIEDRQGGAVNQDEDVEDEAEQVVGGDAGEWARNGSVAARLRPTSRDKSYNELEAALKTGDRAMTRRELKEQLEAMLEALPEDKATLLVDFAAFLSQQVQAGQLDEPTAEPDTHWDAWEREVIAAEEYWFSLPEKVRRSYGSKTVAVVRDSVLDADDDPDALAARVEAQYPGQPMLYVEATAERLPALILRSPRFG
jgi:hypothetical protein